jgi:hypothetical protein
MGGLLSMVELVASGGTRVLSRYMISRSTIAQTYRAVATEDLGVFPAVLE